jgi:hypothetical protein
MWHAWQRREKCTRKARRKDPLGIPRRRWEDGIRIYVRKIGWGVWIGFDWLRIGNGGEIL